jgi:hypothetical protein
MDFYGIWTGNLACYDIKIRGPHGDRLDKRDNLYEE